MRCPARLLRVNLDTDMSTVDDWDGGCTSSSSFIPDLMFRTLDRWSMARNFQVQLINVITFQCSLWNIVLGFELKNYYTLAKMRYSPSAIPFPPSSDSEIPTHPFPQHLFGDKISPRSAR